MKHASLLVAVGSLSACAPHFSGHPGADEVLSALDTPWVGRAGIEESHLPESCAVADWRDAALRALHTVDDPALSAARRDCEEAVTHAFIPNESEQP